MRTNGCAAFCIFIPLLLISWYDIGPILARYTLWIGIWAIVHYISLPCLESILLLCFRHGKDTVLYQMLQQIKKNAEVSGDEKKLYNLRRLLRAQIYCFFAGAAGVFLYFRSYRDWPSSLLLNWDPYNNIFFELAIANWLFASFEDSMSYSEVISHMTILPNETKFELFSSFATNLTSHHVITIFAYAWSLYSRYLGGLCVFGLLFEVPVLLMNLRDFIAAFEKELNYPHRFLTVCQMKTYSYLLQLLFHSCRTLFCLLWPYSLIVWRKELTAVPIVSRCVYHYLGATFCYVNWHIFSYQITRYMLDDMVRVGILTKEAMWKHMKVEDEVIEKAKQKEEKAKGKAVGGAFTIIDQSKEKALEQALHPVDDVEQQQQQGVKYTIDEVALHNQPHDAWFVIDDVVYDVTKFLEQHPGGKQVLLDVAGTDASAEFEKVGHSNSAKMMLQWYVIGQLATSAGADGETTADEDSDLERTQSDKIWRTRKTKNKVAKTVRGAKKCEKMILSDSGPYMQFRPYYNDLGYIVLPSVMFYYCFSLMVTSSMKNKAEGATTANDSAELLIWTFSAVIMVCGFYALLAFTGAFRFNFYDFRISAFNLSTVFSSTILSIWISTEFALMMGYGLASAGEKTYNVKTVMKYFQLSLLCSFIVETIIRKAQNGDSRDTGSVSYTFMNASKAADGVTLLLIISFLLDMTALYRYTTPNSTNNEIEGAFTAILLVLFGAIMRCIGVRILPGYQNSSDEASHAQMLSLSTAAVLVVGLFAFFNPLSLQFAMVGTNTEASSLLAAVASHIINPCNAVILGSFSMFLYYQTYLLRWSTLAFTSQSVTLLGVLPIAMVTSSVLYARWFAYGFLISAAIGVSVESWRHIKKCGKDPPKYLCCAKQMEDGARYTIGMLLARFILTPLEFVLTMLFPPGYMLYVYPGPVTDMGDKVDYGIAYQVNAKKAKQPNSFILNVGFFGQSAYDYARTAGSTADMMMELARDEEAGEKGFVSDMVAAFPIAAQMNLWNIGNDYGFREVNFSTWTSDQAAHDWYVNSKIHRGVVKEYHNGGFFEFSAMLASLRPARPIRWEVRCRECRMMSPGPGSGTCPHCGYDKVEPLPYM